MVKERLGEVLFNVKDSYVRSALRDLFALGCYVHASGDRVAGRKLCATAIRGAHAEDSLDLILKHLLGNERELAQVCCAHAELNDFMNANLPRAATE